MAKEQDKPTLKERLSKAFDELNDKNLQHATPDCPGCRASKERLYERYNSEKAAGQAAK